LFSEELSV